MDELAKRVLDELKLPQIITISREDFEREDSDLLLAKSNRSRIEYYFTCTPSLPLYVLNNWAQVDLITYLDADLFFFSNPDPIFEQLGEDSIGIIGHRFPDHLKNLQQYGIYNVGWLTFKRDREGLACLKWWRERCVEWCYDRCEKGRFADQKYMDDWPERFPAVRVIDHKGANVAPWNLVNHVVAVKDNRVWIGDEPLIFFHFQGFKHLLWRVYNPNFHAYHLKVSKVPGITNHVIRPYVLELSRTEKIVHKTKVFISTRGGIRSNNRMKLILKKVVSIGVGFVKRGFVIVHNE